MKEDRTLDRRQFIAGVVGATAIGGGLSAAVLSGRTGGSPENEIGLAGSRTTRATRTPAKTSAADSTAPAAAPTAPAATFRVPDASGDTLRLTDLPRSEEADRRPARKRFSIDVSPESVVLTAADATVNRPLEFVLDVEDASGTAHTVRTVHGPSRGKLEVAFDVGDVRLPTVVGGTASVRVREAGGDRSESRLVASQHHVGVPYRLSDGTAGTYWASDDSLNGPIKRKSGCVHETLERGGDYVVITAQRFRGKTFGASATIPKAHYRRRYDQRFNGKGAQKVSSVQFAARRDDPPLNRYARDLSVAIERAGFTEPREKVLAAARTVQTMRYKWGKNASGTKTVQFPLQLLINTYGVCSGRTVLLAYLLATEHFGGITTAYGDCRMRGVRHWAPGIDVRGLGYEPGEQPDEWYTFSPTENQAFEYTEYAFLESITVRDIGEFDESIYTTPNVWDTVELKFHDSCC